MRVNIENLEPSDDYLTLVYEGTDFNGIAFELDEKGNMLAETSYVNGQKSGPSKEWSDSILIKEMSYKLDALDGYYREYHSNSALKVETKYELGICLTEKKYGLNGELLESYVLSEDEAQFRTLKQLRKNAAK